MIQIGILGCARICRRGMIAGIRSSGVAQLAAIASRRLEMARSSAGEFEIPKHYGSYEELLADRAIDAVYIPLPNELHATYTMQAAAAGKHILCEKPLARTVDEAAQMVAVCRRFGVMLMEAFMWRHHPRVTHALRLIGDGKLGELRLVKMDFSFDIDRSDWRLDPARGGGAVFDIGCYGVNAARLFARSQPVEVAGWTRRHARGVDMTSAILMRFSSGILGLIDCSFECPYRNRLEVVGTKGVIEFSGGVLPEADSELVFRHGDSTERLLYPHADQYAEQVKAFCDGIHRGALPEPAEDGLANMQVIEEILQRLQPA